jgi:aspartokinase
MSETAAARIRLGGIKILEGRSHLSARCAGSGTVLADICSRMAADRINISHLTHIHGSGEADCAGALAVDKGDGFSGYFHLKAVHGGGDAVNLHPDVSILSVFPHDQKGSVAGGILGVLDKSGVRTHGIASSTAALSVLVSSADTPKVIDALFEPFEFPTYRSPYDWHAAYKEREHVFKEIICSYEEQIVKVYNIARQPGLDMWKLAPRKGGVGAMARLFREMDLAGIRLPFLVAQSDEVHDLLFAVCCAAERRGIVRGLLEGSSGEIVVAGLEDAAMFSLHGPHFGDRYGIAGALVSSMLDKGVSPLALCCSMSSISAVVRACDFEAAAAGLESSFQTA